MTTYSPAFARDAAERCLSTYLQAFIGLLIASTTIDLKAIQAAAIAAIPAGLSVVKSVLAEKYAPGTISPASLAKR
jgi:hypothetical protein